jgi:carboxyl-terminal processing protease
MRGLVRIGFVQKGRVMNGTKATIAFGVCMLVIPGYAAAGEKSPAPGRLIDEARQLLRTDYYDEKLDPKALEVAAVEGMMAALNGGKDGPNKLLTPSQMEQLQADLKSEVVGVGVRIDFDKEGGSAIVMGVLPGSPAQAADLQAGDRILSIDGATFKGKTLIDMVGAMRGKEGTSVKLAVLRGAAVAQKTIPRRKVSWPAVEQVRYGDLGIVTIREFSERTPADLEAALKALEGIRRLVVDLRENPGGLFDKGLAAGELLLPQGAEICRTVSRGGATKHHVSRRAPILKAMPMAVLVDGRTGSSAELLAEALRAGVSATLVGTRTVGKWRVEMLRELSGGYVLKYTVATLRSPRGQTFDGKGLTPDLEVNAGTDPVDTIRHLPDLPRRLEADPQLKAAVHVLRLRG